MSDLIVVESVNPVAVFSDGGLDEVLQKIAVEARSLVPDVSSERGRKQIASVAYKIARSKTHLDDLGKRLVADQKAAIKLIDAERKRMRDSLDALKDEVRAPLTEFEAAEAARVAEIEARVVWFDQVVAGAESLPSVEIEALIDQVQAVELSEDAFPGFLASAGVKKDAALSFLRHCRAVATKAEQERAELERLRAEAAERERLERERLVAAEAEAKAKADAAAAVAAAERRAAQAEADAAAAAQRERDRIAAAEKAEADSMAARMADREHRGAINREIVEFLVLKGMDQEVAMAFVRLAAVGLVPHVSIKY